MKVKSILSFVFVILFGVMVSAQERQVGVTVDLPAKSGLSSSDVALGGKAYLPFGERIVVEADMDFRQALTSLLAPTDQVDVAGMARVYLATTGDLRPFIAAGVNHTMPLDNPDFTQGRVEAGFNYKNRVVPIASFTTDEMQGGTTVIGRDFGGRVEIFIPTGPVNLQVTPYIKRVFIQGPVSGNFVTQYGAELGFNFKF